MSLEYLLIGALTRDLTATGWQQGGTGTFAARALASWGVATTIITPAQTKIVFDLPSSCTLLRLPSSATATFENRYQGDARTQWLHAAPTTLDWATLGPYWRTARLVHLAPLAQELTAIPPRSLFPQALIGLTAQGWLRMWDSTGRIQPKRWQPTPTELAQIDALVVSDEDVGGNFELVASWAKACGLVAMTQGSRGATIWINGTAQHVAAYPAQVSDPTGAGDVWAAAWFWRMQQGAAPLQAADWACQQAALQISGQLG
ncbi:PfkB family carbohydrate kinase [Herpetosiphon giganteus]|uniref:PfkB family carbohydrate kinase n=1 Tax=Herpetosiphon giganteus TaxID=2029754 RepID=UPI00195D5760|nr:PfkB family carbohydrate kinase [Herpetosiphon giganteus]MBM7841889.1 hypothetical protein [Herpetosiphon giganteus]